MSEVIYLNGKLVSEAEAVVSVNDRGFLFGDAVYEAVRSHDG
ncbi:MAG: branched-chain amino acid aminotransferase, partial [Proteobacteria bacterium]|nr:branched-chain amino acid aminotransferase [Pseudomonadota bacterium]